MRCMARGRPRLAFLRDRRGEMDEAAIVFPVLLLIAIGLVNMALFGIAAVNAGNAALRGAHGRRGAGRPGRAGRPNRLG